RPTPRDASRRRCRSAISSVGCRSSASRAATASRSRRLPRSGRGSRGCRGTGRRRGCARRRLDDEPRPPNAGAPGDGGGAGLRHVHEGRAGPARSQREPGRDAGAAAGAGPGPAGVLEVVPVPGSVRVGAEGGAREAGRAAGGTRDRRRRVKLTLPFVLSRLGSAGPTNRALSADVRAVCLLGASGRSGRGKLSARRGGPFPVGPPHALPPEPRPRPPV